MSESQNSQVTTGLNVVNYKSASATATLWNTKCPVTLIDDGWCWQHFYETQKGSIALSRKRVLTHHAIRALLRLRRIIQTSMIGSYMRKIAWRTGRFNIEFQEETNGSAGQGLVTRRYYWKPEVAHSLVINYPRCIARNRKRCKHCEISGIHYPRCIARIRKKVSFNTR